MNLLRSGRRRNRAAALAAAALALSGLTVLQAPSATAAASLGLSVTPGTVSTGTQTFTVRVDGGTSYANVSSVQVTLPASFTDPSVVAGTLDEDAPGDWTASILAGKLVFQAHDAADDLGASQHLQVQVQAAVAGPAGAQQWTAASYKNHQFSGGSSGADVSDSVTVQATTQTIDFPQPAARTWGDAPFTVSATGGLSGNPVTFAASGACTSGGANGATITLTSAGTCTIVASQAAGSGYSAAAPVTREVIVAKSRQSIVFTGPAPQVFGAADITLDAVASSGLSVSYSATGQCTVSGSTLSITGAGSCSVTAGQVGNDNFLAAPSETRTFSIAKATATVTLDNLTHTYDGDVKQATATTSPAGLETVSIAYAQGDLPVAAPRNAGTYSATATLDNPNYAGTATASLTIAQRAVTGSIVVSGKTYDGTTAAAITGTSLSNLVPGDDVELTCTGATFDSADAGPRTATAAGCAISGPDSANYTLTGVGTAGATIARKVVTGEIQAGDKVYDATTTASVTPLVIAAKVGSDDVAVKVISAEFEQVDVGTDLEVTASIELEGEDADNYELSSATAVDLASITVRSVNGAFTVADKVWDGSRSATVTSATLSAVPDVPESGPVADNVELSVTNAQFDTALVGVDKPVTATVTLVGPGATNYVLANAATIGTTADITAKWRITGFYAPVDMTVQGIPVANRTWNTVKAGSTVPLKFEVFEGIVEQTSTAIITTPSGATVPSVAVTKISCTTGSEDAVETVSNAGATALRYDATGGQFIQNWKTPAGAGSCYRVTVTTLDGATTTNATPAVTEAYFKTK